MPSPEKSKADRIAEVKRLRDMYNRDLADAAEGVGRMSEADEERARNEVERLNKELEELEKGA